MSSRQPHLSARLQGFGTTIFTEMTRLALQHGAVNLGQGFPNFDGPEFIKDAAIAAIRAGHNQYARMAGVPDLNRAIAGHQRRFYGLDYDPDTEITVYSGATEAICAAFQALCDTGDEVVLFEPFYDSYRASITMAGAVPRVVTLRAPDFRYDPAELAAAITPKTRAILLNSPHNPTGKVFSQTELEHIAALCREHDLLAITDEVYEHLVYEGTHVPLAALPGMRERTVLISSSGKTFSFTGWKVGHTCAPPALTAALRCAHQFVTFCTATPLQHALVPAYLADDTFFTGLSAAYRARRDRLCDGLRAIGLDVLTPAGTYFVMTDIRSLGFHDDVAFCRMLPEKYGVAAIPPSAFYINQHEGRHLVRWAFCKTDDVLDEGLRRLQKLRPAT
ncbi:methionine aminotransferase [Nannocystis sp.]|uniref:methionine aminotransferase n=1 Tax=Nannocystis sp. TaxID=1962667 RepID=UPI0024257BC6|nr:methionine aminotransferase [Nannocystis sp.]MBK7825542.1 aminotransferase class I/II-fold pyridoxal phosphate-dependent enzyme [Nannocystis sp.]MBK9756745.1 aminotransferase class I/II-fold pyridoxal phosphate-dependent enzyme [Nannocystis sp.]